MTSAQLADARPNSRVNSRQIARFVVGLFALLAGVALLAHVLRPQLEGIGREFVDRFGYVGMALGTLLADGFQFPVPPQFYMLMAVATQSPALWVIASVSAGSLLGGLCGFYLSRKLRHVPWLERRVASHPALHRIREALGTKSLIALSVSPVAFSWLIYFCGFSRYPWRFAWLLIALRLPKVILYYWLVRAGWSI